MREVKNILGVDVVVRNSREDSFTRIIEWEINNIIQWVSDNPDTEVKKNTPKEDRQNIANNNAKDVDGYFTALFYMSMIKEPVSITLDDILRGQIS